MSVGVVGGRCGGRLTIQSVSAVCLSGWWVGVWRERVGARCVCACVCVGGVLLTNKINNQLKFFTQHNKIIARIG